MFNEDKKTKNKENMATKNNIPKTNFYPTLYIITVSKTKFILLFNPFH